MSGEASSSADPTGADDASIDALAPYGWDARWAAAFAPHAEAGLAPARVAIEFNHLLRLRTASGEVTAQHAGRLRHEAAGRHALAAVGDWVAVRLTPGERTGTIEAILPRRSQFSRKVAGGLTEQQVVAANIDVVFIVMGLDRDYNPRRLERYLVLAAESGATPIVLLTKADLVDDVAGPVAECLTVAAGRDVWAVSVRDGRGIEDVRRAIAPGRTGTLLGSSGAGKSTLINHLIGHDLLATGEVRPSDSRGRHTTRHRQLVLLPGGGLLIDTPGMRELQLWTAPEPTETSFEDIEALAQDCRFSDCRHVSEPRCAVRQAADEGRLDPARLDSYLKLQAEARSLNARLDVRERVVERAQAKTVARSLKQLYRARDRQ
ncbi:MAG: ribosome small subunit-dependent GTPase A [Vicinamibacterales bacterium]